MAGAYPIRLVPRLNNFRRHAMHGRHCCFRCDVRLTARSLPLYPLTSGDPMNNQKNRKTACPCDRFENSISNIMQVFINQITSYDFRKAGIRPMTTINPYCNCQKTSNKPLQGFRPSCSCRDLYSCRLLAGSLLSFPHAQTCSIDQSLATNS
jgi:hypothetical protein